jgi:indole-3-glycerol phosphate synthase
VSVLAEILENKRREVAKWKRLRALGVLRRAAFRQGARADFEKALRSRPVSLIAEVKRRSPSAGVIREPFNPAAIALDYEAAGAQAVSVLMDETYFGGGEEDFARVRAAVKLPLLYKEFVIDEWQVWHAASLGASAVLLIARALMSAELVRLLETCRHASVAALVEVHEADELRRALDCGARIVGINNRDLRTFRTSVDHTLRLLDGAPAGPLWVSESGIRSADDVARLRDAGVRAVLVGEHLLRQPDLRAAVRELMPAA